MSKSHVTKISLLTFIALLASLSLLVVSDIDTAEGADVGTTFEQDDPVGSRLWEVPIIRVDLEGTTFEHDGLSYEVTGANTVSVISGSGIGDLSIPSSISYDSETYYVTAIGDRAFSNCTGLTSVTMPDSVTSIGDDAFYNCTGLTSLTIPDSVISIGDFAFDGCEGLTSVTMPIDIEASYKMFYNCTDLTSVVLTKGHRGLGSSGIGGYNYGYTPWAESSSDEISIIIEEGVKSIGDYAFYDCTGLTSVTIPDSVISIGNRAFYNCTGLTSLTIPDSVTSIGDDAFYNCTGLTSLTIPDSVISIGNFAFDGCEGLTSVTMPIDIKIAQYMFYNCTDLTSVVLTKGQTGVGASYPSGNDYQYTPWHQSHSNGISITIEEGVKSIGSSAFYGCVGLTSLTIPDSVTFIDDWAFSGLTFYSKDREAVLDHTAHDLSGHHFIGTNAEMMTNAEIIKSDNTDRSFATEAIAGVIIAILVTVLIAVWVQKRKGRL